MLSLRLDNLLLSPFKRNTGTPQCNLLSPVSLVRYLKAVIRNLASQIDEPNDLLDDMFVYTEDDDFVADAPTFFTLIETEPLPF